MDLTRYKHTVAFRVLVSNVIFLTAEGINPATYRATVTVIDVNDLGANDPIQIGYYIKDYIGHTYSIIGVNGYVIDISDDFRCGIGVLTGFTSIVYKSVWSGRSPALAPVYYSFLSQTARDYSNALELDALWSNDPNPKDISFTNTNAPSITGYQSNQLDGTNLALDYGEKPKFELYTIDGGVEYKRQEVPYINRIGGLIDSVVYDLSENCTGFIRISR